MVDAILTHTLLPTISSEFLNRLVEGKEIARVHVGCKDSEFSYSFE
jgi:type VI secretion system protein VasG